MKRSLWVAVLLGLAVMALSSPAPAQCGCYCGANTGYPCSDQKCKQACGWKEPSSGSSSAQPSYNYEAERQRQAEIERQRQEADRQRRQQEADEQRRRDEEKARREKEEFKRRQREALDNMKDLDGGSLGLKGGTDSLGLKDLSDSDSSGLGLKGDTSPPPRGSEESAWDVRITDPTVAGIGRKIWAVVPPPVIPAKEAPINWNHFSLSEKSLKYADDVMAAWDMAGPLGSPISKPLKVIMIAGKTFIAGEDGAALYLVKKDQLYDQALGYLKSPAQSQQFARLVKDIRENRPLPASANDAMVAAARAIADPKLDHGSVALAWDFMTSREALSAMLRKASIEIGSNYLGDKAGDLLKDVSQRRAIFDSLRNERREAVNLLERGSVSAAQRDQLKIVIDHANHSMAAIYRVEKVDKAIAGVGIGEATDGLATALLGPEAGESGKK